MIRGTEGAELRACLEVVRWTAGGDLVAVVGSRSASKRKGVMSGIRQVSGALAAKGCLVVTGGALGADQAAMEGALGLPPGSLDSITPVGSGKLDLARSLLPELTGLPLLLDEEKCEFGVGGLLVLYPDFRGGYHPRKYLERDRRVAKRVGRVLAFWDGESAGTRATMEMARRLGRTVHEFIFQI